MKTRQASVQKRLSSLILAFTLGMSTLAYGGTDTTYCNRLYYLCKAWGHVKYYHTEVGKGVIDWDQALFNAVRQTKNATSNNDYNQALLTLLKTAGPMWSTTTGLPPLYDSLNNNKDYSWIQHQIFNTEVRDSLTVIKQKFRPFSSPYIDAGLGTRFDNDQKYSGGKYPNEEERLLALFRYWNIIHYFFPYKHIMDQHWDSTLVEFIPGFVEASDAQEYGIEVLKLIKRIDDTHATASSITISNLKGLFYTPFLVRQIEGKTVITKVVPGTPGIKVGDVIKAMDGKAIKVLRDSLSQFASASNDEILERVINQDLLKGDIGLFPITVNDGQSDQTYQLERNHGNISALRVDHTPAWKDTILPNNCKYGIVNMGKLETQDVPNMFNDLWDMDVIVFDVRNYPNGTLWSIINYLSEGRVHLANFTEPDVTYPGRFYWKAGIIGGLGYTPYSGKIKILFDERTQSQAEYTVMGLEQFPDALKIGSTTASADGNIAWISLPGKIRTSATFLGVYYPDFTPTQRVGIIPDIEIRPTIKGIRAGRDEVMERALECKPALSVDEASQHHSDQFYPNPVVGQLSYNLKQPAKVKVYDLQGAKIWESRDENRDGVIDFSNWKRGSYLIQTHTTDNVTRQIIVKQ